LSGDFIDQEAGAADLLLVLFAVRDLAVVIVKGNHEVALVEAYCCNRNAIKFWLK
jgi:hypothetical protein